MPVARLLIERVRSIYNTGCYIWAFQRMRTFVTKAFRRFARAERISHERLLNAVDRANRGLVDAELGGGLVKQRVARPGQGRSGGYRTVIVLRRLEWAVFLYGFAKSDGETTSTMRTWARLKKLRGDLSSRFTRRAGGLVRERRTDGGGVGWPRKYQSRIAKAVHETAAGIASNWRRRQEDDARVRRDVPHDDQGALLLARSAASASRPASARRFSDTYLNVPTTLVSQWERGQKKPSGPSLKLLISV